jgi:succinyl-diaminopimelate desuccinylase
VIEADIRLPPGMEKDRVMAAVRGILARYPEATMEEINFSAPSVCDPNHEMVASCAPTLPRSAGPPRCRS